MVHLHCELPTRLKDQTRVVGNRRIKRLEMMPILMGKLKRLDMLPRMIDHRFSSPTAPVSCKVHCIPEACPCVTVDDLPRVLPKKATGPVKRLRSDGTADADTALERSRFKVSAPGGAALHRRADDAMRMWKAKYELGRAKKLSSRPRDHQQLGGQKVG